MCRNLKWRLIATTIIWLSVLLQACAASSTYAPVTTNSHITPGIDFSAVGTSATTQSLHVPPATSDFLARLDEPRPPTTEPMLYSNVSSGIKRHRKIKGVHPSATTIQNSDKRDQFYEKKQSSDNDAKIISEKNITVSRTKIHKHKKKHGSISSPQKATTTRLITTKNLNSTTTTTKYQSFKNVPISIDNKKMLKLAFSWPIKGVVVKSFRQSKDKGIEIAGKVGQRVYAAEAGKVVYGGRWLVGFGNLLVIKHDAVYLSAYAHNSRLLVQEGQRVLRGQPVARIGHTPSGKTALHFEIRKNGKAVDPLRFLPN